MILNGLQSFSWIYDLHRLGQGIVKTEDASSACQLVLQHIVKGFEADSGSLALLNHTENCLTIVAGIDLPEGVISKRVNIRVFSCAAGKGAAARRPLRRSAGR